MRSIGWGQLRFCLTATGRLKGEWTAYRSRFHDIGYAYTCVRQYTNWHGGSMGYLQNERTWALENVRVVAACAHNECIRNFARYVFPKVIFKSNYAIRPLKGYQNVLRRTHAHKKHEPQPCMQVRWTGAWLAYKQRFDAHLLPSNLLSFVICCLKSKPIYLLYRAHP